MDLAGNSSSSVQRFTQFSPVEPVGKSLAGCEVGDGRYVVVSITGERDEDKSKRNKRRRIPLETFPTGGSRVYRKHAFADGSVLFLLLLYCNDFLHM